MGDVLAIEEDLARRGLDETRDHAKKGGLSAAGWAKKEEKFAWLDVKGDIVDRGERGLTSLWRIGFGDLADLNSRGHGGMVRGYAELWDGG